MSSRRLLAAALCAAWLLLAGRPALADPREDARVRLEEGSLLYRKGDYQGALRKFEEARALYPSPKLYFNLGQTLYRLGRAAAAVDAFEKFLAEVPDAPPERRLDAERFLGELRPRIGYVRVRAAAGSEIAVDGQPAGIAPLRRTIPVDPGPHQLTARAPGAAIGHVGRVEVEIGQTVDWEAKAAPAPLADDPTPPARPLKFNPGATPPSVVSARAAEEPRRPWWPWAAGGAAVVAAVVVTAVLLSSDAEGPKGSLGFADLRSGL
jgi:hypothetical protein